VEKQIGQRAAGRLMPPSAISPAFLCSQALLAFSSREIQLHSDAIGIVAEELGVTGPRHDALPEFDAFRPQSGPHALHIGDGKGDKVERLRVLQRVRSAGETTLDREYDRESGR